MPVVAFSPDQSIRRRLALYWGVVAKVMEPVKNADLMVELVAERLVADGVAKPGDRVVLVHGSPLGVPGRTNSNPAARDRTARRARPGPALPGSIFKADLDVDLDLVLDLDVDQRHFGGGAAGTETGSTRSAPRRCWSCSSSLRAASAALRATASCAACVRSSASSAA